MNTMKRNSYLHEFITYTSLNVLGMIGVSCYILADTFFISKGLGANGLVALNLAIPIYSFIHGSGLMIGMGGATKYAIRKSQGNQKSANRVFTVAAFFALLFAVVFVLLGLFGSEMIVRILGADETVFEMTKVYLKMILLFSPAFLANNLLLCFVRNDGAPQLSMAGMLGGSLSNILLDYLFIFPLGMGMFGAVLATCMAPFISMLILSPFFLQKKNCFRILKCSLSGRDFLDICSGGLPSLITEISSGIVIIIFNAILLDLQGNMGVAAYGIIANLSLVLLSIYTGMAQGIQPLLSSSYGEGNHAKISTIRRYALTTMLTASVVIYSVIFFGAAPIAGLFNSEGNELLQNIATNGLRLYFIACPFAGFNIILCVYFTSTGQGLPAHILSLLRGFVLIIPMAFLLSAFAGLTGVWCTFPLTEFLLCLLGIAMYLHTRRKPNHSN